MLYDTPEAKQTRYLTKSVILAPATNPMITAAVLMEDLPQRDELPATAVAMNHYATTMAYAIIYPDGRKEADAPQAETTASAAAMLTCSAALNAVVAWMRQHPEKAQAIEQAIQAFTKEHRMDEHHFNHRRALKNTQAVESAADQPQPGTGLQGPPKEVIDGLSIIARHADLGIANSHRKARDRSPLYFHDTHYDQYTAGLWARTLLRTIG